MHPLIERKASNPLLGGAGAATAWSFGFARAMHFFTLADGSSEKAAGAVNAC
jgi:hypothetical protein